MSKKVKHSTISNEEMIELIKETNRKASKGKLPHIKLKGKK